MKNNLKTAALLICIELSSFLSIQAQDFEKDQLHVSLGYGVGLYRSIFRDVEYAEENPKTNTTGPISAKVEYGVGDAIGFGAEINYISSVFSYDMVDMYTYEPIRAEETYEAFSIMLTFNRHFGQSDHFDPYTSLGTGFKTGTLEDKSPYETTSTKVFPLAFKATFGFRWHFTDNFGIYVEAGLAESVMQFGLTQRF